LSKDILTESSRLDHNCDLVVTPEEAKIRRCRWGREEVVDPVQLCQADSLSFRPRWRDALSDEAEGRGDERHVAFIGAISTDERREWLAGDVALGYE
jgi:hypothetical protein